MSGSDSFVAVLIPLWSSYLVRVYVWRLILSKDGVLNWALENIGLGSLNIGYSNWAIWIVFSYIWLPFMILPIWSAFERLLDSYIEASADLGARGWQTFRTVVFPLVPPGIAAVFVPILIIVLYAFNPSNVQSCPLDGLSTKWFSSAWHNAEMRHAFWLSIRAGLLATAIALLLGSMAAFAAHRFRFFGREAISFIFVLPIALPG